MDQRFRWLLFSFFVFLFVIIAGAIITTTLGLRYDVQRQSFVKTGTFAVTTQPENADIFLNDELLQMKTPAVINNLLPGTRTLRLEKDGFYPWEKIIHIEPTKATVIQDVYLFKKTKPTKLGLANIFSTDLANTNQLFIARAEENAESKTFTISRFDIEKNREIPVTTLKDRLVEIVAADENVLLANITQNNHADWHLFQKDQKYRAITEILKQPMLEISSIDLKRSPQETGVYFLKINAMLWRIELQENEVKTQFYAENVRAFDIQDAILMLVTKNQDDIFFIEKNLQNGTGESLVLQRVSDENNAILTCDTLKEYTCLFHNNTRAVFIQKNQTLAQKLVPFEVQKARWYPDMLLLMNEFEIWTYNKITKKYELVTRQSHPLSDFVWHSKSGYILAADNQGITAIERNGNSIQQKVLLYDGAIPALYPENAGEKIFFIEAGNLYALPLAEEKLL